MSNKALSVEANIAYQAFQEMRKSKEAYFKFLQEIDIKYKVSGSPSIAENQQLEELLGIHDKNVVTFNKAMTAVEDFETRTALIKLMS